MKKLLALVLTLQFTCELIKLPVWAIVSNHKATMCGYIAEAMGVIEKILKENS